MQTALRVLAAINDKHTPEATDVEELRRLAPMTQDLPVDELACEVIQLAIRARSRDRARSAAN